MFRRRIPIQSEALRWVQFDRENRVLRVGFITRKVYDYRGVPEVSFQALLRAESKGRYFNTRIRDHYPFDHVV